jgi:hypothetical protein
MLANYFFSDLFTDIDSGIVFPETGLATGTTSGSAIALTGSQGFEKWLFEVIFAAGSVANTVSMWLATATASGGVFTSLSASLVSILTTLSLSANYRLRIDSRDVWFSTLSSTSAAPTWVQVVVSVTGSTISGAMHILGWEAKVDPSNVFAVPTLPITKQVTLY